jgi:predicted dehydrogenase
MLAHDGIGGTVVIRAAVIGLGYLGNFHAEKYLRSSLAELVAVVDVRHDHALKWGKKNKVAGLADFRKLLDLDVQCVSIVSDTKTHYQVAKWCLENGIDVLVEKPMTVLPEEARELVSLAAARKRILQVGHLERFNPAFRAIKQMLIAPRFFEVRRIAKFAGRGHDVDVVLDLMIHDIDIVTHLVGRPVVRLEAVGVPVLTESVDIANARLTFEGGAIANVTASRAALASERTIRIFQQDLYISLDFEKKRAKTYQKTGGTDLMGFPKVECTEWKVEERDALADEINSFLECVAGRKQPLVTGEDGLRALELAEKIREAVSGSSATFPTAVAV